MYRGFKRKFGRRDWVVRRVLHRCRVCSAVLDCDRRALSAHANQRHQMTLQQYADLDKPQIGEDQHQQQQGEVKQVDDDIAE